MFGVIGLALICLVALWYIGIFNKYNYLTAKSDISNNVIQIIQTGEMISPDELNKISEEYGFKEVEYSCILSGTELRGIGMYNAEMEKHLNRMNGKGWRAEYNREIDSRIP